jgi:hypothetical protein
MGSPLTEPGKCTDIGDLIRNARDGAQAYADTVRHFGEESPQVLANIELGLALSSSAASSPSGFAELKRYRGLVSQREASGWMDNTTLLTAVTLMSHGAAEVMTPLTIWDLATFVRAAISYERIYHHAHPQIDDRAINQLLGQDVICAVPLPMPTPPGLLLPDPWEGPHRFMCELWEESLSWLKRLSERPARETLDGRELRALQAAWSRALNRPDIQVEDFTDWKDISTSWISPSDELLQQIAQGTSVQATLDDLEPETPMRKRAKALAEVGEPSPAPSSVPLTALNIRAHINQRLADFFELPYLCGAARVPFRKHLYDRAVIVQQRLTTLDVIDDRYAELAAGVELRLPLFLSILLPRAQHPSELWDGIRQSRKQAAPYRAVRLDLDLALARGNNKEIKQVSKALHTSIENMTTLVGKATVRAGVAAVDQVAKGDPNPLTAGIAGAEAAGRAFLGSTIATRLMWRLRRPSLLWLSNVIDEAQQMTEALPDLARLWRIPEKELPSFAARFDEMARLQSL